MADDLHDATGAPIHGLAGRSADLLRFATAGSVDDGKSTLIGRLLSRREVPSQS